MTSRSIFIYISFTELNDPIKICSDSKSDKFPSIILLL